MDYVIEMLNITKRFPGVVANDQVTLQVKPGEIHALLGENGAGKSTLMSILFGLYQPDEGEIRVKGQTVKIHDPNDAFALKIGMVHQHFKLIHNFTVADNILLGQEATKYGFLSNQEAIKKIEALSEKYKLKIDPYAKIADISVGMQQRVEILKMLYRDAEVLIFDEPTAVLTPQEIIELMKTIKTLAAEGKSIILITHKLEEIKQVADRVTILRKGKHIATLDVASVSTEKLAELMVGRKVVFNLEKQKKKPEEVVLEVKDLNLKHKNADKNVLSGINFEVRKGEIVAIAGVEGNGQSELVKVITGLMKQSEGSILFKGEDISHVSIRKRTMLGIGHIPEDRHRFGLVLDFTLEENLILQTYHEPTFQTRGFLQFENIRSHAERLIEEYDIRSGSGAMTIVRGMSGGNQQKAIIARELDRKPDLLIAVQPTRGLDVGAIEGIHKQLIEHRDQGKAVLLVSLELDEVMNLSDRILVMYEGEIVANLDPETVDQYELGLYMAGAKRGEKHVS